VPFSNLNRSVVKSYKYLYDSYVPDKLISRDNEIKGVEQALGPIFKEGHPKNMMLLGKPGTGKTVVSKYVIKQLDKYIQSHPDELDIEIRNIDISCGTQTTQIKILTRIIYELDPANPLPKSGYSAGRYYDELYRVISRFGKPLKLILIFDEVDKIDMDNIIYNFSRASGETIPSDCCISMLCTTNNLQYLSSGVLSPRTLSSAKFTRLVFSSYDAFELTQILEERANKALYPNALGEGEGIIEHCAALAARDHGDARHAIELLYDTVKYVEDSGRDVVLHDDVEYIHSLEVHKLYEYIPAASLNEQLVMCSVCINSLQHSMDDVIVTGDVRFEYYGLCRARGVPPASDSSISRYLNSLENMRLIATKAYKPVSGGNTRKITISVPADEMLDYIIKYIDYPGFVEYVKKQVSF
jgi:cell division control protein 6